MEKMKRLGIYVHIPFCRSKCAYCDFYSLAGRDNMMDMYQKALISHIRESSSQLRGYVADTVYFGGGTPSYYGARRLIDILEALKKYANVLVEGEITLEANPDSVSRQDLSKLRRAGFNRISIGAQCANDGILKSIGRPHNFEQVGEAVKNARSAGFENVSLDLIYGLPSQTKEDWADTLTRTVALKPDHLSCYGLTIEPGTALYPYREAPYIPDADAQADMYLYMTEALERYGYRQYEISNFAKRDRESRHNLKYWTGGEYMGFGAAAHSYVDGRRFAMVADVEAYSKGVLNGSGVVSQLENITDFEQAGEYLMLGLRTVRGISEAEYKDIFPCSFDDAAALMDSYVRQGWMRKTDDRWSFTPKGFLVSNTLIGSIIDCQTTARMRIVSPDTVSDSDEDQISLFGGEQESMTLFRGL